MRECYESRVEIEIIVEKKLMIMMAMEWFSSTFIYSLGLVSAAYTVHHRHTASQYTIIAEA